VTAGSTWPAARPAHYYDIDDRDADKRMKRHLAGKYNDKAKWEQLLAEKEASSSVGV